jgi:hypothetical protein
MGNMQEGCHHLFHILSDNLFPRRDHYRPGALDKCEPFSMAYTFGPVVVKRFIAETSLSGENK